MASPAHYERPNLLTAIAAALAAAGKRGPPFGYLDLAPVDHFHTGGLEATRRLAGRAKVRSGDRILDVGGGLGGSARVLTAELGADVTVVDATAAYCAAGAALCRWTATHVSMLCGDALALPVAPESFDVVWTQHAAMNIADRASLYREVAAALRAEGLFALHDVVAGDVRPVHFPVPWAREATDSHLISLADLRRHMNDVGLVEEGMWDESAQALAAFEARRDLPLPALGVHVLLGQDFPAMAANQARNLREGRVHIVQAVFRKARVATGEPV